MSKKIMLHCTECKKDNLFTYLHIEPTILREPSKLKEELIEKEWGCRLSYQTAPDRHPFLHYLCPQHNKKQG